MVFYPFGGPFVRPNFFDCLPFIFIKTAGSNRKMDIPNSLHINILQKT